MIATPSPHPLTYPCNSFYSTCGTESGQIKSPGGNMSHESDYYVCDVNNLTQSFKRCFDKYLSFSTTYCGSHTYIVVKFNEFGLLNRIPRYTAELIRCEDPTSKTLFAYKKQPVVIHLPESLEVSFVMFDDVKLKKIDEIFCKAMEEYAREQKERTLYEIRETLPQFLFNSTLTFLRTVGEIFIPSRSSDL